MWATGAITIDISEDAKASNKGEVLVRHLNKTGNDVGFKFDENAWGTATEGYAESAGKLRLKSFTSITTNAKEIARKTHRGGSRSSRSVVTDVGHVEASKDQRAMLVDVSEDDD